MPVGSAPEPQLKSRIVTTESETEPLKRCSLHDHAMPDGQYGKRSVVANG
jgi:hypothetical protein